MHESEGVWRGSQHRRMRTGYDGYIKSKTKKRNFSFVEHEALLTAV
jgi:hypothetical protein